MAAFEAELGREVAVHTVPLGHPVPGLPDLFSQVLTALETYDSPLGMAATATAYGVSPTSLADFVHHLVAANRQIVG